MAYVTVLYLELRYAVKSVKYFLRYHHAAYPTPLVALPCVHLNDRKLYNKILKRNQTLLQEFKFLCLLERLISPLYFLQ